jgi:hypothetical protein
MKLQMYMSVENSFTRCVRLGMKKDNFGLLGFAHSFAQYAHR